MRLVAQPLQHAQRRRCGAAAGAAARRSRTTVSSRLASPISGTGRGRGAIERRARGRELPDARRRSAPGRDAAARRTRRAPSSARPPRRSWRSRRARRGACASSGRARLSGASVLARHHRRDRAVAAEVRDVEAHHAIGRALERRASSAARAPRARSARGARPRAPRDPRARSAALRSALATSRRSRPRVGCASSTRCPARRAERGASTSALARVRRPPPRAAAARLGAQVVLGDERIASMSASARSSTRSSVRDSFPTTRPPRTSSIADHRARGRGARAPARRCRAAPAHHLLRHARRLEQLDLVAAPRRALVVARSAAASSISRLSRRSSSSSRPVRNSSSPSTSARYSSGRTSRARVAGTDAALDVVVEARAVGAAVVLEVAAGAQREDAAHLAQRAAQVLDVGVGPEVARAVAPHVAGDRRGAGTPPARSRARTGSSCRP